MKMVRMKVMAVNLATATARPITNDLLTALVMTPNIAPKTARRTRHQATRVLSE
jgi:hypothetical protein